MWRGLEISSDFLTVTITLSLFICAFLSVASSRNSQEFLSKDEISEPYSSAPFSF